MEGNLDRSFRWLLIGSRSGVGAAVLRAALACGRAPVIGATSASELQFASRHKLGHRALDLADVEKIRRQLLGVELVVQAGRLDLGALERLGLACLHQGCALMDLSDQLPEHLALRRHAELLESGGIPWIVSAGAASVTASLLSAHLHDLLPDAASLSLSTHGPDPRLAGIDLRWWRSGSAESGWCLRRGKLIEGQAAPLPVQGRLQAYPWRADLADGEHARRLMDVDTLVEMPVLLRSPRMRRALADRPVAASRIEHCVHRFGPPGWRKLTATGRIRCGQGHQKEASLSVRDALEVQVRVVLGLVDALRAGRVPGGVHTPLAALGTRLAPMIGLHGGP